MKRRDALITGITLRATHENGETHELKWMWTHEVVSYIRGLPSVMNLSKQDRAIALVASPNGPLSKTLGFMDPRFQASYKERAVALFEQYRFLKDRDHGREEFLDSQELARGLDWLRSSMYWAEGNYQLHVELTVEGGPSPVRATFRTALSGPEVDLLQQNVRKMSEHIRALVGADAQGQTVPEPIWNWVYPALSA